MTLLVIALIIQLGLINWTLGCMLESADEILKALKETKKPIDPPGTPGIRSNWYGQ